MARLSPVKNASEQTQEPKISVWMMLNHPKPITTFVKHIIGNKYTDFQPNLSIFEGPVTFSVEKKVSKSRREKRAK